MNVKTYIESGIIEQYCLGLLSADEALAVENLAAQFPAIVTEIDETRRALDSYLETNSVQPRADLKAQIQGVLANISREESLHINQLPIITAYSDYRRWATVLAEVQPLGKLLGIRYTVVRNDEIALISKLWLQTELIETEHHNHEFRESFLVLEGNCECNFGGQTFHLSAGSYIEIPENTPHVFRNLNLNSPLIGIIQRLKTTAH